MKTRTLLLSIGLLSLLCGCGETFSPGFPEELRDCAWKLVENQR